MRSKTFRTWFEPAVPPHFALAFDQPIEFAFPKKGKVRGPKRKSPFLIGIRGRCGAHVHGCKATFECGLTDDTIRKILDGTAPQHVDVVMNINGTCSHLKGKMYGQLRGEARASEVAKIATAKTMPSKYAKEKIGTLSAGQHHSQNRAHVPTKRVPAISHVNPKLLSSKSRVFQNARSRTCFWWITYCNKRILMLEE